MSNAIFSFNGLSFKIPCTIEEKMEDICFRFALKINMNLNNINFMYRGNLINLELKFGEIMNRLDNDKNEMNILVYEKKSDELICQNCGIIYNNIIKFNNNLKDILNDLKDQLQIIVNNKNMIN